MMDPVEMLVDGAVQHQVVSGDRNPYLTMETIVLRLISKILDHTRVSASSLSSLINSHSGKQQPVQFPEWHEEIRSAYETSLRNSMSQEERSTVERILSKDHPHPVEFSKFACCLYKYDRAMACKLFAVDGILGDHPKFYTGDAFSSQYAKHNDGVRELYAYYDDPDEIRSIVLRAYEIADPGAPVGDLSHESKLVEPQCIGLYAEIVGEEEIKKVVSERLSKSKQLSEKPTKRKANSGGDVKKNKKQKQETAPRPASPAAAAAAVVPFSPPYSPPHSPLFPVANDV